MTKKKKDVKKTVNSGSGALRSTDLTGRQFYDREKVEVNIYGFIKSINLSGGDIK